MYLYDEADISGEGLHPVEAGNQAKWQEALLVHLLAQEEIPLQVAKAEVVLTTERRGKFKNKEDQGTLPIIKMPLLWRHVQ